MKRLLTRSLLLLAFSCLFSCSKKDAAPPVATLQLGNTIWSGQYAYTTGSYVDSQPFSITLATDSTLTWSDLASTRPGGTWSLAGNVITVTFPNKTIFTATAAKDGWSNIVTPAATGITIDFIKPGIRPDLDNTEWKAQILSSNTVIGFLTPTKLELTYSDGSARQADYTIEGGGVKFNLSGVLTSTTYYGVFQDSSTLKGIRYYVNGLPPGFSSYDSWIANKVK